MEPFSETDDKLTIGVIWGQKRAKNMAPRRPIFFTHLIVVPVSLNEKLQVNPMEPFSQIDEKLTFGLILALFGAKKGPKIWPWEAQILETSQCSSSELKQ